MVARESQKTYGLLLAGVAILLGSSPFPGGCGSNLQHSVTYITESCDTAPNGMMLPGCGGSSSDDCDSSVDGELPASCTDTTGTPDSLCPSGYPLGCGNNKCCPSGYPICCAASNWCGTSAAACQVVDNPGGGAGGGSPSTGAGSGMSSGNVASSGAGAGSSSGGGPCPCEASAAPSYAQCQGGDDAACDCAAAYLDNCGIQNAAACCTSDQASCVSELQADCQAQLSNAAALASPGVSPECSSADYPCQ